MRAMLSHHIHDSTTVCGLYGCHDMGPLEHSWISDLYDCLLSAAANNFARFSSKLTLFQTCPIKWSNMPSVSDVSVCVVISMYVSACRWTHKPKLSRLSLSHWDPYAMRRGGCLELYYCNMVEWSWWDSGLIWKTNWFSSVLWHCWFGHMTCKNRPRNDL